MSDNDLISRMALYEKTAEWEAQALHMVELHLHDDDKAEWRKWSTVLAERSAFKQDVADAPAVPHEMSAREFLCDFHRLCQSMGCDECPITHDDEPRTCAVLMGCFPDETIETVEQWAKEHPEERSEDNG